MKVVRSSAWEHRQISVPGTTRTEFPATLHLADYTVERVSADGHLQKEKMPRAAVLSIKEKGKHKVVWAGYMAWIPSPEKYQHFIEIDGEYMRCSAFIWDLELAHSYFTGGLHEKPLSEDECALDRIVDDINQMNPTPFISKYTIFRLFDRGGHFFLNHFRGSFVGDIACTCIAADGDVFCFEIENLSYPRKGKIWIDMKKKALVKVVDLTDKEILSHFSPELFGE